MSSENQSSNYSGNYPALTKEIASEIFESAAPYRDDAEKEACQRMVKIVSSEAQHSAACTSYAYWFAKTYFKDEDKPSDEIQLRMAMREARRHLVGSNHDEDVALDRFLVLCEYRIEHSIDLLRSCYPPTLPDGCQEPEETSEETDMKSTMRSQLEEELSSKQAFFVRGHDSDNRAVAIKMGRQSPETNHKAFVTAQLYVAERAIACSEFLSKGTQEKVLAVMDFEGYSSSNAPPMLTLKESLGLMQSNYPERLKTAIITEPAFWMKGLYNLLYPLMSTDTREKIQMAYGEAKVATIRALLEPEQAMPFMMPDGKLESSFEAETFLKVVPFHCLY